MSKTYSSKILNKILDILWPIHKNELGKFIPMTLLMFFVLFNQNTLRVLKDSILISEVSAEVTSFAKVYFVTPAAAIFVIIYTKMVNNLTFERIYFYLNTFFLVFFLIFAFILYPNAESIHINSKYLTEIMEYYPHFKWYIALVGNWSYILFYTLAELWPNIFYILLFWQLANEITTTEEAQRFYTLFSLFGNSSLIIVGLLMMHLSTDFSIARFVFNETDSKIALVKTAISLVAICTVLSYLIVLFISKNVMTDPFLYRKANIAKVNKPKMGILDSFGYILNSRYLWLLLICSAAYGLSMNLIEAVWRAKIKELYPTVNSYANFQSLNILWTGIAIMVFTIVGRNVMRSYNWFVAAVISPLVILITGVLFFILIVYDQSIVSIFHEFLIMTPLALAVSIGAIQNILAKGSKYSIWDTSREMLYIPLDEELKTKGKASVDIISSKIGKSSSGLIISFVFTLFPRETFNSISSSLMVIFIIVCIFWIYAIWQIYEEYKQVI